MKAIAVFAFVLLLSNFAAGQSYVPMLSDSSKWYMQRYYYFEPKPGWGNTFDYSSLYYIDGKTTFDSIPFYKLFYKTQDKAGAWTTELKCYLREDTTERKVYLKISSGSTEQLLYNFNLLPNDNFYFNFKGEWESYEPNSDLWMAALEPLNSQLMYVNTVVTADGLRKRFNFREVDFFFTHVEGGEYW
ncbi:MAG: hypothetical protein M3Q97_04860, partial [Bacteroidota bacterium]|nr:hypothetical protein [Bacteroidota bacterium]